MGHKKASSLPSEKEGEIFILPGLYSSGYTTVLFLSNVEGQANLAPH